MSDSLQGTEQAGESLLCTSRPRRRWWRWGALGLVVIVAWLGREAVLRAVGGGVAAEREGGDCRVVLVLGGDRCFEVASALYQQDPTRRIVLLRPVERRTETLGAIPDAVTIGRRELQRRGVRGEAIEVLPGTARDPWAGAHRLADWLAAGKRGRVLVLCSEFDSRRQRIILDVVLSPEQAQQVAVCGLPDRRFTRADWWRSRYGTKQLVVAYVYLLYTIGCGDREAFPDLAAPEAYQARVRAKWNSET